MEACVILWQKLFQLSKRMKMCIWSDVTEVQGYEIHYVNAWLKWCIKRYDHITVSSDRLMISDASEIYACYKLSKLSMTFPILWFLKLIEEI